MHYRYAVNQKSYERYAYLIVEYGVRVELYERSKIEQAQNCGGAENCNDEFHYARALLVAERLDNEHQKSAAEGDCYNAVVPFEVGGISAHRIEHNFEHGVNEQHHGCGYFDYVGADVGRFGCGFRGEHGYEHYYADCRYKRINAYRNRNKVNGGFRSGEYYGIGTRKRFAEVGGFKPQHRAYRIGQRHKEQSFTVIKGEEQPEEKAHERYAVRNYRKILFALICRTHNKSPSVVVLLA